jgi:hypothetical protein
MIIDAGRQIDAYLESAKEHDKQAAAREATLMKAIRIISNWDREEAVVREQMLVP